MRCRPARGERRDRLLGRQRLPDVPSSLGEIEHALAYQRAVDQRSDRQPRLRHAGHQVRRAGPPVRLLKEYDRDLECFEVYCGAGTRCGDEQDLESMFEIFTPTSRLALHQNFGRWPRLRLRFLGQGGQALHWAVFPDDSRESPAAWGIPEHVSSLFEPARDVLADNRVLLMGSSATSSPTPVFRLVVTDGSRMPPLMALRPLRDRRHTSLLDSESGISAPATNRRSHVGVRGRTISARLHPARALLGGPTGSTAETTWSCRRPGLLSPPSTGVPQRATGGPRCWWELTGRPTSSTSRGDELDKCATCSR